MYKIQLNVNCNILSRNFINENCLKRKRMKKKKIKPILAWPRDKTRRLKTIPYPMALDFDFEPQWHFNIDEDLFMRYMHMCVNNGFSHYTSKIQMSLSPTITMENKWRGKWQYKCNSASFKNCIFFRLGPRKCDANEKQWIIFAALFWNLYNRFYMAVSHFEFHIFIHHLLLCWCGHS